MRVAALSRRPLPKNSLLLEGEAVCTESDQARNPIAPADHRESDRDSAKDGGICRGLGDYREGQRTVAGQREVTEVNRGVARAVGHFQQIGRVSTVNDG